MQSFRFLNFSNVTIGKKNSFFKKKLFLFLQLIKIGVKAIIQPGGSINDKKIIKVSNDEGIIMAFTKTRHFKH